MHTFMHVAGVACLAFMAGAGIYTIWSTIAPRRVQIAVALAPIMPAYTNAYRARVDSGRRKVAALIALVLVCAASLYRGGFA
ncbi:hypothetical protein QE361_001929 [Sphingomonas sp. SORGH_AS802]|uniref:hypothetical protein n=1 Tax=unclassified Sphingomonas TaxID=196159 RepID=UPI0028671C75|nr:MULTISPECIES: hypothetical protein [unclassified Sphingomonas]MDR6126688.1 hypothetical protein [Sphingomonas sp. SORGH_AS_0438]MDR6134946.1 hypothetical protein [Sphingomonas sp. SORGH_AS_0802]